MYALSPNTLGSRRFVFWLLVVCLVVGHGESK
jgi:hypothetical protein